MTGTKKATWGLSDIQIHPECKSDGSVDAAGSKVVVNFSYGEYHLTVLGQM